ncbi:IclR family transcriptional regulator [Marispirochaeta sp.]|jgi:IclR family transcriptional regulator, KDG regulon repressor|uniref:IclR family transcriptional regulator n=1 Tax=Marispirochaeta sp. TaxID=2038653 RepID=UPI0029C62698|nr:IclR family transcriptional regulator [Marispirochaeta sp.]
MSVQSIDRTFDILELLAHFESGLSLTEISEKIDLPKSTVHRLLKVLRERNYIEKSDSSNVNRLGLAFIELCSGLLNSLELKTEAQVYLRKLSQQTGQVVFLAIRQDGEIVYIDKTERHNEIRDYCFIGQRRPLYCTALGKSLLMGCTDDEIRELVDPASMTRFTDHTITDIDSLINEIHISRDRGYSIDNEEVELDMKCVSAPILDYRNIIIAAVSTSWDLSYTEDDVTERNVRLVMETARSISLRMGYRGQGFFMVDSGSSF